MMTPRECYNRVLRFKPADYVPNFEFGPMNEQMRDEWRKQGMPEGVEFADFFGIHPCEDYRHILYTPIPGVPNQGVIEETDEHVVTRGPWGRVLERKKRADMATGARHPLREGIRNRADWNVIKDHFRADEPRRYPDHWETDKWSDKVGEWKGRDWPLFLRGPSMMGIVKEAMGFENFCIQLYDDRALVEEIMEARTQLAIDILGRAFDEVEWDCLHFFEDIAFNSGPVIPPAIFEQIALPRYGRLSDFARSHGVDLISVDSDGDISELIPLWLKGGINYIWPMEVNAGMDVVALRSEYGRDLAMLGGVNKFALLKGRDAIDRELDRIAPVVRDGGYIPQLDHQVPYGVTFDDFCYYMEQKKKLLGVST